MILQKAAGTSVEFRNWKAKIEIEKANNLTRCHPERVFCAKDLNVWAMLGSDDVLTHRLRSFSGKLRGFRMAPFRCRCVLP
jgi:hypothetical protein